MTVTGEARSTQRKPCPIATLSTIYLMWITLDSNPSLRRERSANTWVRHGTTRTYHNPHRNWNNFVSPRPFLGCLTLEMKVLEPSVKSVNTYQSSGRSIPAEVLNLILPSYVQATFLSKMAQGVLTFLFRLTFFLVSCTRPILSDIS